MIDYTGIFRAIESSLIASSTSPDQLQENLKEFRYNAKRLTDEEMYELITVVIFASGFNAETMNKYRSGVKKHFPDIATAVQYTDVDLEHIRDTKDVIRHPNKLKACVHNAKVIQSLAHQYGSLQAYIDTFAPFDSMQNIIRLKEALNSQFAYLGPVTTFHFLTDIGLPVLKPDRVIMRLFRRLGLIENEEQFLQAILEGNKFAEATNEPIRYIDMVLVTYGQARTREWGIEQGICLEKYPKCSQCGVSRFCDYFARQTNTSSI